MLKNIGMALIAYWIFTRVFPPRKINLYYGYRSKRARKNQESWDYANSRFEIFALAYGIIYSLAGSACRMGFESVL